jgi:hypothetical protein
MSKPLRVAVSMSSIVNTFGALGVIGSLVFVGMELQQSRQIALGTQQQMRTELRAQLFIAPLEGNFDAVEAMYLAWDEMTPEQKKVAMHIHRYRFITTENNFIQRELGLLADSAWSNTEQNLKLMLANCNLYESIPTNLILEFKEYFSTIETPCK